MMIKIHDTPQIEPVDARNLAHHLDRWIEAKQMEVSTVTVENYRNRIKPLLLWWKVYGPPDYALTPQRLTEYRHWLENTYRDANNRQPAPATIHTYCAALRSFLRWLYTSHRLPMNIAEWIQIPEKPRPRGRFLSIEECQGLFDAARGTTKIRDWAILALLLGTGCRAFEAAEATKAETTHASNGGSCILRKVKFDREGKRKRGRVAIFGPTTAQILRVHLLCNGDADDPRLLQLSNVALAERVEVLAHRAGIKASPHDLRRTFADWWMDHATDDRAYMLLKLQLGHSLPQADTTAIHYLDLDNHAKTENRLRRCYTSPVEEMVLSLDLWG